MERYMHGLLCAGDCQLTSGGTGIPAGGCAQANIDLIYRACLTHPDYVKCQNPPAAYGLAAISAIQQAVAKCNT